MGMGINAQAKMREGSISAVVTRADGTIEDRGIISYYSRNPIKHYAVNAWIKLKDLRYGTDRR